MMHTQNEHVDWDANLNNGKPTAQEFAGDIMEWWEVYKSQYKGKQPPVFIKKAKMLIGDWEGGKQWKQGN